MKKDNVIVMEKITAVVGTVVTWCLFHNVKSAVAIVSPNLVAKATNKHKPRRNQRHREFIVSMGTPNFAERRFIKQCNKAGEPFPVKKIQLKHYKP